MTTLLELAQQLERIEAENKEAGWFEDAEPCGKAAAMLRKMAEQKPVAKVTLLTLLDGAIAKVLRLIDESPRSWIVNATEGTLLYAHPISADPAYVEEAMRLADAYADEVRRASIETAIDPEDPRAALRTHLEGKR